MYRSAKEITDRLKFVAESTEYRHNIRQRMTGILRISASLCCTTVFVGCLLRCVDFSDDVNSGTAF